MRIFNKIIVKLSIAILTLMVFSCTGPTSTTISGKVSSQLSVQITLRQAQIDSPTPERLKTMHDMGMNTDNLQLQRIYIRLNKELTQAQIDELKAIGITLYLDSWIPPLSNHPTGFMLADMPIGKLAELTQKEYIVSLDTAEVQFQPQNGASPQ
jgi:hypothetical protein